jgi:hypothetical protein
MSRKYKYTYVKDKYKTGSFVRLPFLRVKLAYGHNLVDVVGLIDTGAEDSLFDAEIADALGIDIKATNIEKEYFGIAGQSIVGYVHSVQMQVQGFSEWIDIEAGFFDTELPYPLIGESGFLDNYQLTLMRYKGRFEIKSRSFLGR